MNPLTISAQFAAFTWFTEQEQNARKGRDEAMRFARQNWQAFLPLAHKGWGRLLLKIAGLSARKRAKRKPARAACCVSLRGAAPEPTSGYTRIPLPCLENPFSRN
jgi:hypothetical protein